MFDWQRIATGVCLMLGIVAVNGGARLMFDDALIQGFMLLGLGNALLGMAVDMVITRASR